MMKEVYCDFCLSRSNVFLWHKLILDGRDTLDDKHPGRPSSFRIPEIMEKVRFYKK